MLAYDVAETGERQLVDSAAGVLNSDDRLRCISNFIPQHGVDFDCYAVASNRLLLFSADRSHANIDNYTSLDSERDNPIQHRPANPRITAQPNNHSALILAPD